MCRQVEAEGGGDKSMKKICAPGVLPLIQKYGQTERFLRLFIKKSRLTVVRSRILKFHRVEN